VTVGRQDLHPGLFRLRALSYLDISHNRLSSVQGIESVTSLRHLDVSNNRLQALDEELTSLLLLEHFDVSFNRIGQLPDTFGLLNELRFLNLSHNRIAEIPNERFEVLGSVQVDSRVMFTDDFCRASLRKAQCTRQ